jgi:hypothetical protein
LAGVGLRSLLYHVHGLGPFDFSSITPTDLASVQDLAVDRDVDVVPTIYLRRQSLGDVVELIASYARLRDSGLVPNILGFAIEGPMLGPDGGIPPAGRWFPTVSEWTELAQLGEVGLRYIVMAPDALDLDDELGPGFSFADLILRIYGHKVRIALGHFHRDNPPRSASRVNAVLDLLHSRFQSSRYLVLTDHLYNDMPRAFTHAWRTPEERTSRGPVLQKLLDADWSRDALPDLLGPVPAALLGAALDDRLMPCINFDDEHVDLEIAVRTANLLGKDRLIALTDHTEVNTMAGEAIARSPGSGLRRRSDGAVAAGSAGPDAQRANMVRGGIPEDHISKLLYDNPRVTLEHVPVAR